MAERPVLYRKEGHVATLTLNRPESLNAMNEALVGELEHCLMQAEADPDVRTVVLTGAGRGFCSGGDQKRERGNEGEEKFFDGDLGGNVIERLNRCVLRMQHLAKPIVGCINGVAVGAGCNLALATESNGDLPTALPMLKQAYEQWKAKAGVDGLHTLSSARMLGATYRRIGDYDPEHRRALGNHHRWFRPREHRHLRERRGA